MLSHPRCKLVDAHTHAHTQQVVWQVVGLAALNAMTYGRSRLWAQALQADRLGGQRPTDLLASVARAAVVFVWSELQDFVLHRRDSLPAAWEQVGAGHPFIQQRPSSDGVVSFCLNVPDRLL